MVRHDPPRNSEFPAAEPSAVREAPVPAAQVEHIEDPRYSDARLLLEQNRHHGNNFLSSHSFSIVSARL